MFEGGKSRIKNQQFNEKDCLKSNRKQRNKNIITIKRSNKVVQALGLPVICNLNPRSVYNKIDEFHEFVKEEEVDLNFMSDLGNVNI